MSDSDAGMDCWWAPAAAQGDTSRDSAVASAVATELLPHSPIPAPALAPAPAATAAAHGQEAELEVLLSNMIQSEIHAIIGAHKAGTQHGSGGSGGSGVSAVTELLCELDATEAEIEMMITNELAAAGLLAAPAVAVHSPCRPQQQLLQLQEQQQQLQQQTAYVMQQLQLLQQQQRGMRCLCSHSLPPQAQALSSVWSMQCSLLQQSLRIHHHQQQQQHQPKWCVQGPKPLFPPYTTWSSRSRRYSRCC